MKVYVTGGVGFIGSALVHTLLSEGHEVAFIDDLSTGTVGNLDPRATFRILGILDDGMSAHMAAFSPEVVVHLAAQSSVSASIKDPGRSMRVNAEGTAHIAQAAVKAGARRVISASSAAVYGTPMGLPLAESALCAPESPYGKSKLEGERRLSAELDGTGVDYASLRFANVYGPRQVAGSDGGVVAVFLAQLLAGLPPVIHGEGGQTRDFIFVGDVVAAILAALACDSPLATQGAAYNISTGIGRSILELIGVMRQAVGYFGDVEHAPVRAGDIEHSVLDPSKAAAVLGWKASVDLETGIGITWPWYERESGAGTV
ncbi:MAG: NAD-dependent epimerase/dehydratase family protein [Coriobacteriia bacterium]|nr:NAD-dependent epimerase/dehydratase family protein [Coriobacteriia bacterium]